MSEARRDLDTSGVTGAASGFNDTVQASISALYDLMYRLFDGLALKLPLDGADAMTGDLDMDGNDVLNAGNLSVSGHTHTLSDVTDSGALAPLDTVSTSEIDAKAVSNSKLASMAARTWKGNNTDGAASPGDTSSEDLQTELAQYQFPPVRFLFADFMYNGGNNNNPYYGAAVSGGNSSGTPPTASLVDGMGVVLMRSTTTANSGYGWRESTNKNAGKGDLFYRAIVWVPDDFNNKTVTMGHHNTSTVTEPTHGSYFRLSGSGVVTPKSADGGVRTSGSTYTISADTWYIFEILWNSDASSINYKILSIDKATTHLDVDITTNISTGLMGAGIIATSSVAAADDLVCLDYQGHGFATTR